jgi:hypothetical protein
MIGVSLQPWNQVSVTHAGTTVSESGSGDMALHGRLRLWRSLSRQCQEVIYNYGTALGRQGDLGGPIGHGRRLSTASAGSNPAGRTGGRRVRRSDRGRPRWCPLPPATNVAVAALEPPFFAQLLAGLLAVRLELGRRERLGLLLLRPHAARSSARTPNAISSSAASTKEKGPKVLTASSNAPTAAVRCSAFRRRKVRIRSAIVERAAAREPGLGLVPEADLGLALLPAEVDLLIAAQ